MRISLVLLLAAGCGGRTTLVSPPATSEPIDTVRLVESGALALPNDVAHIALGDVDADRLTDLIYTRDAQSIDWARSDGAGNLTAATLFTSTQLAGLVRDGLDRAGTQMGDTLRIDSMDVADMDLDGRVDILLRLRFDDANGARFAAGVLYAPTQFPVFDAIVPEDAHTATAVGDLNGDGLPEWLHLGPNNAVHTSSGDIWPVGDEVSWAYYPEAATFETPDGPVLTVFVNGGFGISEVHTWRPGPFGLQLISSRQDIYSQAVAADRPLHSAATHALVELDGGLHRFDGQDWTDVFSATEPVWPYPFAMGDLTGDGELDALLSSRDDFPTLVATAESGQLEPFPMEGFNAEGSQAWIADVTGEGLGDVLTMAWEDNGQVVTVWVNEGE